MSVTLKAHDDLFDGGPPMRWQRALGLVKPNERRIALRARLVLLIGWVPPAVFALVHLVFFHDDVAKSFFTDFAAYARYLIAGPVLVLAEAECIPRLGRIARHFVDGGFVVDADRDRYEYAVKSTMRLLDSKVAEVVTVILAYALVAGVMYGVAPHFFPGWQRSGPSRFDLSLAGWWRALVSTPLLLVLIIGWLWRILLWGRFLYLMEQLDLRLIPGHPDQAGGLKFISTSLRGFRLLSFALGTFVAGTVANRVHGGASPLEFKPYVIVLAVAIILLSAGPLTIFLHKLRGIKRDGTFSYGTLAGNMGHQFEQKWLGKAATVDQETLGVPDFSSTTDLYSVVANVYEIKDFTFGIKNLAEVLISGLVPFLPIALLVMPLKEILQEVAKLLL